MKRIPTLTTIAWDALETVLSFLPSESIDTELAAQTSLEDLIPVI
jgi:hypothetical protein